MHLNKTLKLGAVGAFALGVGVAVHAVPITGTISFFGDVVAVTSTAPGAPVVANGDFTQAHALRFGVNQFVAAGPSGAFAGVLPNTIATMYSPLQINAPALPPPGQPLWTVTDSSGDTFKFTLTSLFEPTTTPTVMVLEGTGTIHEVVGSGPAFSDNTGTWVATFNSASTGPFVTFSWSSSAAFNPPSVPEAGSTALFLGLGLLGLGGFSRMRKVQAVA
jgi:hypothetical protein